MEKENNILITFDDSNRLLSEEIQIRHISLYEIEHACKNYDPAVDYLQILANLLLLKSQIKQNLSQKEIGANSATLQGRNSQ